MAPDGKKGGQDQYFLVLLDSVEFEGNFGVWQCGLEHNTEHSRKLFRFLYQQIEDENVHTCDSSTFFFITSNVSWYIKVENALCYKFCMYIAFILYIVSYKIMIHNRDTAILIFLADARCDLICSVSPLQLN